MGEGTITDTFHKPGPDNVRLAVQRIFDARVTAAGEATQAVTDAFVRRGRFGRPAMTTAIRNAIQPIYVDGLDEAARLIARVHAMHLLGLSALLSACEPAFFAYCERFVDLATPRGPGASLSAERVWFNRELSRTLAGLRVGLVSTAGEVAGPPTVGRAASALLRSVYALAAQDPSRPVPMAAAAGDLGLDTSALAAAERHLLRFGLLERAQDHAEAVRITAQGIAEAESLIEDPERPTAHLPPALPRFAHSGDRAARTGADGLDPAALASAAAGLRAAVAAQVEDVAVRAEAEAALDSIGPQLARAAPNPVIVGAALDVLARTLDENGFGFVLDPYRASVEHARRPGR